MTQNSKIKDLVAGQKKIYLKNCEVIEASEVREQNMKNWQTKEMELVPVCDGKLKDETGEISFSAWDGNANKLSKAKRIDVDDAYCKSYDGLKLTTGRFGNIKVLEKKEEAIRSENE